MTMHGPVLLVVLPPNPLGIGTLKPNREAAVLATRILDAGGSVQIADLGTLEFLDRLLSQKVYSELHSRGKPKEWEVDFSTAAFAGAYEETCLAQIEGSLRQVQPECISVFANDPYQLHAAKTIIPRLLSRHGKIEGFILAQIRSGASQVSPQLLRYREGKWEPHSGHGETWWRDDAAPHPSSPSLRGYAAEVYPALTKETKTLVFDIGSDEVSPDTEASVFVVLEECGALLRGYGTHAFHFGQSVTGTQLARIATELLARRMRLHYSLDAAMGQYRGDLVDLLRMSGCKAAYFVLRTGSQLLAEDIYGLRFRMSKAEAMVRECAEAGIHTGIELNYPCAEDDYHTRDETLRIVRRSMPHAVRVLPPPDWVGTAPMRNWRSAETRRERLETEIAALGILTSVGSSDALLAHLAGYAGREAQFMRYCSLCFSTGDIHALGALVNRINDRARSAPLGERWDAFNSDQRVVGN